MEDAVQIAKKLIADIAAPGLVCGHLLQVSVSVGIAVYPDDAADARSLIGLADAAMYRSKRRGGGSFTFHGDRPAADGPSSSLS
jgi:GGDEF domain-containing protein